MANFTQADFVIGCSRSSATVASSATGFMTLQNYVITCGPSKTVALTVQSDAFSDSYTENLWSGVRRKEPFAFGGFYDDLASSGPHALFGQSSDIGAERWFEVGYGASDVVSFRGIIQSYAVLPVRGALHGYEVEVLPSGAVATTT